MIRAYRFVFGSLLLVALLAASHIPASYAQADQQCFEETGYCISGRLLSYWQQNGGLAVFGYPISAQGPETTDDGQTVQAQWFERNRLELHPENQPPYDVLLGRLGVQRLEQEGRNWFTFPKAPPDEGAQAGCQYFPVTGHRVCGLFLDYYQQHGLSGLNGDGSLALFGLPISEPAMETNSAGGTVMTQWFERARMELHPENAPPYNVELGLLGDEVREAQYSPSQPVTPPPTATTVPANITSVNIRVDHNYPATVRVRAQGFLPNSCYTLGNTTQQRSGDTVTITINAINSNESVCAQIATPIDQTIKLVDTYPAGVYKVYVNGMRNVFTVNQPQTTGWGGSWESTCGAALCGTVALVQTGNFVAGTYGGNGTLRGTVSGNALNATYERGPSTGQVVLTMSDDGQRWQGVINGATWCGWRPGAKPTMPCGSP